MRDKRLALFHSQPFSANSAVIVALPLPRRCHASPNGDEQRYASRATAPVETEPSRANTSRQATTTATAFRTRHGVKGASQLLCCQDVIEQICSAVKVCCLLLLLCRECKTSTGPRNKSTMASGCGGGSGGRSSGGSGGGKKAGKFNLITNFFSAVTTTGQSSSERPLNVSQAQEEKFSEKPLLDASQYQEKEEEPTMNAPQLQEQQFRQELPLTTNRDQSQEVSYVDQGSNDGALRPPPNLDGTPAAYDIGNYVGTNTKIDTYTRKQLLLNHWRPPKNYEFPFSEHKKQGRVEKRKASQKHLDQFPWLVLSDVKKGYFCLYCPLFTAGMVGGYRKNVPLGALVTQPVKSFAKVLGENGILTAHGQKDYHQTAIAAGKAFLRADDNPEQVVINQVNSARLRQIEENRRRLKPIVETIILLGKQNIALRGHGDDGPLLLSSESPTNEGNFRELLRYRVRSGDGELEEHLKTSSSRATFISKTTQNDLIECCGEEILSKIISRVQEAEFYSVLFDETTDIAHESQLTQVLRYVYQGKVHEDFIGFINLREAVHKCLSVKGRSERKKSEAAATESEDVDDPETEVEGELTAEVSKTTSKQEFEQGRQETKDARLKKRSKGAGTSMDASEPETKRRKNIDGTSKTKEPKTSKERSILELEEPTVTGQDVGKTVVSTLKQHNLNVGQCVGVGTDGCSMMTSETCGAVAEVQKEAKYAVRCPCYNHALNLSISKASKVQFVRNAMGVMTVTISFFDASSKRSYVLQVVLGEFLSGICVTRWIERHDGVIQFRTHLPKIVHALESIASWKDSESAAKAKTLLSALCESDFIVTVICLSEILGDTRTLSILLQKVQIDLKEAQDALKDTITVLSRRREDCNAQFADLFKEAQLLAEKLGTELKLPRITLRQMHRENHPASNVEDYYRQTVFIPILDNVIEDLRSRFPEETQELHCLSALMPLSPWTSDDTKKIATKYFKLLNQATAEIATKLLQAELRMWKAKWAREQENGSTIPKKVLEALSVCDEEIYPIIHRCLKIYAALPVSVATPERSNSSLRRLKTWLRSTMSDERLTGLALLHVHYDVHVDPDRVIDRFAKKGNRRLEFIL